MPVVVYCQLQVHTCTHIHMHTHTHTQHTHPCTHTPMHTHTHAHAHTPMHTHTMHAHTHTHTHTQYGFVNSALEKLIKRRFGFEKWDEIRSVSDQVCFQSGLFTIRSVFSQKECHQTQRIRIKSMMWLQLYWDGLNTYQLVEILDIPKHLHL